MKDVDVECGQMTRIMAVYNGFDQGGGLILTMIASLTMKIFASSAESMAGGVSQDGFTDCQ